MNFIFTFEKFKGNTSEIEIMILLTEYCDMHYQYETSDL